MPLSFWLELATQRWRLVAWIVAGTGIAVTGIVLAHALRVQATGIDSALHQQVDGIRWFLENLRGVFAPDSSSQPACRDMLFRALKRALRATQLQR